MKFTNSCNVNKTEKKTQEVTLPEDQDSRQQAIPKAISHPFEVGCTLVLFHTFEQSIDNISMSSVKIIIPHQKFSIFYLSE